MASVQLEGVMLAPVSDLSAAVMLDVSSLEEDDDLDGEVRTYAGGRRRSITRAGRPRSFTLQFDVVQDRPLLDTLRGWKGQPVLARDPYGRKVFGVYYRLPISERIPVDVVTVQMVLTEITFSEAV